MERFPERKKNDVNFRWRVLLAHRFLVEVEHGGAEELLSLGQYVGRGRARVRWRSVTEWWHSRRSNLIFAESCRFRPSHRREILSAKPGYARPS